jgi:hypothetical protein
MTLNAIKFRMGLTLIEKFNEVEPIIRQDEIALLEQMYRLPPSFEEKTT